MAENDRTEPTIVPPEVEEIATPPAPLPPQTESPVSGSGESPSEEPVATPEQRTSTPPVQDWRDRRLAQKTAQNYELQEKIKALEARLNGAEPVPASPGLDPNSPEFQSRVRAEAENLSAQQAFNRACDDVAAKGKEAFPDFDEKVSSLVRVIDRSDPNQIALYNQFLVAAIETGEAPRLIHQLGSDPNEAARIMALSPVKMAVELTKLASKEPTQISNTPKPIRPIGTRSTSHEAITPDDAERADNLPTEVWMRRRQEQITKINEAGGRMQ